MMLGCKGLIFTTVVNEFPFKEKNFHALYLINGHNFVDLYFFQFLLFRRNYLLWNRVCHATMTIQLLKVSTNIPFLWKFIVPSLSKEYMQRSNYQLTGKSNSGLQWFTFAGCDWFRKFMSPESFLIESCKIDIKVITSANQNRGKYS